MADYLECTYLTGIIDMGTDAGAGIIIPYSNYSESIGSILGKLTQINYICSLLTTHELNGDIMIL